MVAHTRSYFFYYTAAPDSGSNGTLVAIPYKWPDQNQTPFFTYKGTGNWVDRGDLFYSGQADDYYEFKFQLGVRLTHKGGFDGVGVNIYLDGVLQNTAGPLYLVTGQVYFEAHPNTLTEKTLRVRNADQTYENFLLQTGVDIWEP